MMSSIAFSIQAQEGYFGGSFSMGYASHGVYKVFDDGGKIGLGSNKFAWNPGVNRSSKTTLASSYHLKRLRVDASFSYYSRLVITNDWKAPFNNEFMFGGRSNIDAVSIAIIAYRHNSQSNSRLTISPGIGIGLHKIDLLNNNELVSVFFNPVAFNSFSYDYDDSYLNKSNYQFIGALESSLKIGSKTYLFLNAKYQLGILKMYQRDIEYVLSLNQIDAFISRLQYNGSNYNFNLGLRWHFGDGVGYNIIE